MSRELNDTRTECYRDDERFIASLMAEYVEKGFVSYPSWPSWWKHHVHGVHRTLKLLPHLECRLSCPTAQVRVLDVGCGIGSASVAFARRNYRQVVGLDAVTEPFGVKLARERARSQGLTIHFSAGDGCRLPYASNTFDFCFCDWVIEHVLTPLAFLQEMRRVLVPGGLLYVSTNNRLWPKDPHVGLWCISWLPREWARRLAVWVGHWPAQKHWDIWLLTHWRLLSLARKVGLEILGTRKDIFPPGSRPFSRLSHVIGHLGISVDAFGPNLYLLARKPPTDGRALELKDESHTDIGL